MELLDFQEKLRKAVLKYEKHHTISETAVFFEIGTATVSRWKAQYENDGTLTPAKKAVLLILYSNFNSIGYKSY